MNQNNLALNVPPELIEVIAELTAEKLAERMPERPEPYLNVQSAAKYLDCPKSRIYDLVRDGRLTPYKDGSRSVFRLEDLDAALTRSKV